MGEDECVILHSESVPGPNIRWTGSPDTVVKTVLVLIAMEAEAAPAVVELGLTRDDPPRIKPPAPCISYSGTKFGLNIHLVCNGKCTVYGVDNVGTVPAALTAYLAAQEFRPDLVISAGTAGGFGSKGAAIGDVFLATGFANHDRRIPIPGFLEYGRWAYDAIPAPMLKAALQLKDGVVTSSNSLDWTSEDMQRMSENNAAVKEMEAAGIVWVTHLFDLPFLALKSITDIVDGHRATQDEFLENLHKASEALEGALTKALEFIAGKKIADL
eukprot:jgi/Botrbrau1/3724/Bobra.0363s0009.1